MRYLTEREREELDRLLRATSKSWPDEHLIGVDGAPVPFHVGQKIVWDSDRRLLAMIAGTQGGKTAFAPHWLKREIDLRGPGDYLAVTSTYDLFKLKMLPSFLEVFEGIYDLGRFWAGDRVFELRDPETGQFWARRATDRMWGRVILRSAQALGGLESATAKAAWLDEAGQDEFGVDAWRAIRRRLALHSGRVLITTTLYNLGWVKQLLIDVAESNGKVVMDSTVGDASVRVIDDDADDILVVQYDSILNPQYPREEFEEARATLPLEQFEMFYRGRVAKLRNLIYDVFDPVRHVCKRFEIPQHWPRYVGVDFGGTNTAAMFYAEDPKTGTLYAYREYHAGGRSVPEHARAIKHGEPEFAVVAGGSGSEEQWRREFTNAGLHIRQPRIGAVDVGILRVYKQHKLDGIIYFDDLSGILDEKGRYRRKVDKKTGEVLDEIQDKHSFHLLDAERYIISEIRGDRPSYEDFQELGEIADYESPWA